MKEETERKGEFEPTNEDKRKLDIELQKFKQKRVSGFLASPFVQYLESLGVIRYDEYSRYVVRDPEGFTRLNKINGKLEMHGYYKDQDFFNQNPEAKQAQLDKIAMLTKKLTWKS